MARCTDQEIVELADSFAMALLRSVKEMSLDDVLHLLVDKPARTRAKGCP
jgi:hypothetical protein